MRTIVRRLRALLVAMTLALTVSGTASLLSASPASAYVHDWSCYVGAYQKCFDESGKIFNLWHQIGIQGPHYGGYCAKGQTIHGEVIQFSCASNTYGTFGDVCTGTETQAY